MRVTEGYFDDYEGEVDQINEVAGRVTVMTEILGRSTPVEFSLSQIEPA